MSPLYNIFAKIKDPEKSLLFKNLFESLIESKIIAVEIAAIFAVSVALVTGLSLGRIISYKALLLKPACWSA
jgi:hypothetical protein